MLLAASNASATKQSAYEGVGVCGGADASLLASMSRMQLRHGSAGGAPRAAGDARPSFSCTALQSAGRTSTRPLQLACGSGCVQGRRPTMEDEHVNLLGARSVDGDPVSLFAILDGHCGRRAADLGGQLLPEQVFNHPAFGTDTARAMVEAIIETDRQIFQTKTRTCGAALIFAVVHKCMLYVGCLGDSRAVLCDNGATVPMSIDHKPTQPQEKARVIRCGGYVDGDGYVCGSLALSRALGDFYLKVDRDQFEQKEFQQQEFKVSNVADIRQINLTDASRFLILACDGLWDVMSNEEAVAWVTDFLARNQASLADSTSDTLNRCAQTLAEAAVKIGSTDNVSVTVVLFHAPGGAPSGMMES
jgi:protein phosphatase